jgi:hypothetical protein
MIELLFNLKLLDFKLVQAKELANLGVADHLILSSFSIQVKPLRMIK